MPRMVQCVELGRELPGLDAPPFPGRLGERIYDEVSQQAWNMWPQQSTLVINHYGLNVRDPKAKEMLLKSMEQFLFAGGQIQLS